MKKILLILLVLAGITGFKAAEAMACSCIVNPSPLVRLEDSDTVFVGEVSEITPVPERPWPDPYPFRGESVNFSISDMIKGADEKAKEIEIQNNGGSCVYPFKNGEKYLVYTYRGEKGELGTGLCSGNALADEAQKEIRILKGEARWYDTDPRTVFAVVFSGLLIFCGIKLIFNASKKDDEKK